MRRLFTAFVVCLATAAGVLWWLHDGNLKEAVEPVMTQWDAEMLARNAGFDEDEPSPILPASPDEETEGE